MNNQQLAQIHGISILQALFSEPEPDWSVTAPDFGLVNKTEQTSHLKNDDIMTKYFLPIGSIRNLVRPTWHSFVDPS